MKRNSHLSLEERLQITVLQGKGISVRKIAKALGRSPSTISRELNRENALYYRGTYIGSQTHNRVKEAWQNSHKRENKFLNQRNVSYFIECQLKYGNTPEIICHLLKERFQESVSHETLYIYIYSPKRNLKQYLLRRKTGRLPKKKARLYYKGSGKNIPNRIDIDLRDKLANDRLEFGHFEADSVESCRTRGKRKSCLTVMVDRATRYTIIRKTASLTSIQTAKSIVKAMKPLSNNIKSITYDNGKEFSKHEKINKILKTKSYFCKPYHSWEKGTVENINGLIRRFFPKGTDFDTISEEEIAYVEDWINNRPMKILHYMTPKQKLQHFGVAIAS